LAAEAATDAGKVKLVFPVYRRILDICKNNGDWYKVFDHMYRVAYFSIYSKVKDLALLIDFFYDISLFQLIQEAVTSSAVAVTEASASSLLNAFGCLSLLSKCAAKAKNASDLMSQCLKACSLLAQSVKKASKDSIGILVAVYGNLITLQTSMACLSDRIEVAEVLQMAASACSDASGGLEQHAARCTLTDASYGVFQKISQAISDVSSVFASKFSRACSKTATRLELQDSEFSWLRDAISAQATMVQRATDFEIAKGMTGQNAKFGSIPTKLWEPFCYAALVEYEKSAYSIGTIMKLANVAFDVIENCKQDVGTKLKGFSFVSTYPCVIIFRLHSHHGSALDLICFCRLYVVGLSLYMQADQSKTVALFSSAAGLLERSCQVLEHASSLATKSNIKFEEYDKISDRFKLVSRCKQHTKDSDVR
jgi:hypothetical protein